MITKSMPDFHSQDSAESVSWRGLEVQDHSVHQADLHQADLQVPRAEAQEALLTVATEERQSWHTITVIIEDMKVVIPYTTNLAAEEEPTGLLLEFSAVDAVAA